MSHDFADRPFSFLEFMCEVLHANEAEEHAGAHRCRPEEAHRQRWSGGEGPGGQCMPVGSRGTTGDGPATRAATAAGGDDPVHWCGRNLSRGARRLRRRQTRLRLPRPTVKTTRER